MAAGPLRQAIDNFLTTNPVAVFILGYRQRVQDRASEWEDVMLNVFEARGAAGMLFLYSGLVVGVMGMLPGWWARRRTSAHPPAERGSGMAPLDDTLIPPRHGV